MKLTNEQIYLYAAKAIEQLENMEIYIPAKANFFLQKNIQILADAAKEIEKARLDIAKHYGVPDEEGLKYTIPDDKAAIVASELRDLFDIEQELDIKTFSIEALGSAEFTPAQMQAMLFMIED